MGEGEGPKGKTTLPPPLSRGQNRGGGRGRRRRPAPASQGAAAAGRRGERERGSRGFDSPSYLGLGWSRVVGPWRRAVAGTSGCGGGVAGVEKGWWTAGKVVEAAGVLLGPLL